MLVGGAPFSISLALDQCVVPADINGPVAIWVTSDDQPLNNNARDRGSNAIVAGPLIAFIDTKPESLGQLVRNNGAGTPPPSTSTMPPAQASSLLSSLSGTPTPSGTPAPNNVANGKPAIANGVSMIPMPSSTTSP